MVRKQIATRLLLSSIFLIGGSAGGHSTLAGPTTQPTTQPDGSTSQVAVTFDGGHDTDGPDRGRPVVLVAGALGVPAQVFRDAFRRVHPAAAGQQPQPDQVRQNKRVLMEALSPYGVTNESLDRASNRYRYRRDQGELWPTRSAAGYATVRNNALVGVTVTDGGFGYSSAPQVTIPGFPDAQATAALHFGQDLETNGSVSAITLSPTAQQ